jgi:hypothetical protein
MNSDGKKAGYGNPPNHSKFKPGQSGNPKGRPKGSKNVHQLLSKILKEKIAITDAGKKMVVEKMEGALRALVNKSFEGNPQSLRLLLQVIEAEEAGTQEPQENPFTEEDYLSLMEEVDWIEKVRNAGIAGQSGGSE